jgi:hypothetical protein
MVDQLSSVLWTTPSFAKHEKLGIQGLDAKKPEDITEL